MEIKCRLHKTNVFLFFCIIGTCMYIMLMNASVFLQDFFMCNGALYYTYFM